MELNERIAQAVDRIDDVVKEYDIKAVYALFSGGDDSTVTAYLASHHPLFAGCVFANTLTGDIETVRYVRETCAARGWPLEERKPHYLHRYPAFLATWGVPTPAMHPILFNNLKGKQFDKARVKLAKEHGCKSKEVLLVSGVRRGESTRRQRTVQPVTIMRDARKNVRSVWCALIYDYLRDDLEGVLNAGVIQRNAHAQLFAASRECGCKATEGRQDAMIEEASFPVYWERRRLQYALAQAAYALQEFEVEHGLIDREDARIPAYGVRDRDTFHADEIDAGYFDALPPGESPDSVDGVPFLCVGCENQAGVIDGDKLIKHLVEKKRRGTE